MSVENNKATARHWYEGVFNNGNLDLINELFAANFVDHDPVNPCLASKGSDKSLSCTGVPSPISTSPLKIGLPKEIRW